MQDLGRPGWAHLGVSRSGAADRAALRRANRLVGNADQAAGLEVMLGGLTVRAEGHRVVAVCGADRALSVAGRPVAGASVVDVPAGTRFASVPPGCRWVYLAVRGGVHVESVLGSRSRDTLAGLGPAPLALGDVLRSGWFAIRDVVGWPVVDLVPRPPPPDPATSCCCR